MAKRRRSADEREAAAAKSASRLRSPRGTPAPALGAALRAVRGQTQNETFSFYLGAGFTTDRELQTAPSEIDVGRSHPSGKEVIGMVFRRRRVVAAATVMGALAVAGPVAAASAAPAARVQAGAAARAGFTGYGYGNRGYGYGGYGYGPGPRVIPGVSGSLGAGATLPGLSGGVSGGATVNPSGGLGVGASTGLGVGGLL